MSEKLETVRVKIHMTDRAFSPDENQAVAWQMRRNWGTSLFVMLDKGDLVIGEVYREHIEDVRQAVKGVVKQEVTLEIV